MSTLVEQIEALQEKWQRIPTNHHLRPQDIRDWCERERTNSQLDCAKELTPILAAAREQEQELAAMKEQKKPTYFLGLETVRKVAKEGQMETGIVDFVAADSLFHEELFTAADLREIAQLVSEAYSRALPEHTWMYLSVEPILAAFREKKAKVSDAQRI